MITTNRYNTFREAIKHLREMHKTDDWNEDSLPRAVEDAILLGAPKPASEFHVGDIAVAVYNAATGFRLNPKAKDGMAGIETDSFQYNLVSGIAQGAWVSAIRSVANTIGVDAEALYSLVTDAIPDNEVPVQELADALDMHASGMSWFRRRP